MGSTLGLSDRLLWDSPIGWVAAKVMPHSHAGVYADVAELLALRPDDDLLDIGCGPGAFLAGHGQEARTVTGLDASNVMVHEAENRLAARIAAGTARVVLGSSHDLPFDDGQFSAVTVITAPVDLAQVHRVLRPGGRLVVVDELPGNPRKSSPERSGPRNEADTLALIEQAGFVEPSVRYRSVWHLVDNRIVGCIKAATA